MRPTRLRLVSTAVIPLALLLGSGCGSSTSQEEEPTDAPTAATSTSTATTTIIGEPTPAGPTPLPTAPAEIDTSAENWQEPYREAWQAKPRFDQEIAGILVGPDVEVELSTCDPGKAQRVDPEEAVGTPLEIRLGYWPEWSLEDGALPEIPRDRWYTASCRGSIVGNQVDATYAAAPDAEARLQAGESYFTVPVGGLITIARTQFGERDMPAQQSGEPASSWGETLIAGRPAAIGAPVIDGGAGAPTALGSTTIHVWDSETRVMTSVSALNLSIEETTKIAEGLFE